MHTSPQVDVRTANLLGALSVAVASRLDTSSEAAALTALHVYLGGRPIEALRRVLGLSHPATVRLVDRLVARGLVERTPGTDRRSVALRLTDEGALRARDLLRARGEAIDAVLCGLGPADAERLAPLLEKLLAGLVEDRADARRICRFCDADACGHHAGRCPVTETARAKAPQDYA